MQSALTSNSILVLDSGSGGLTVWQEIRNLLPALDTLYVADFGGFPYGPKSPSELETRVLSLLKSIIPIYRPVMIVIACNTASTLVLEALRQHFSIPIVGVVPAIKTASALSQTGQIGLLATFGTVQRQYTDQLIAEFAPDCQVARVGSNKLVQMGEDALRGKPVDLKALYREVAPVLEAGCDQVVLGCTHFPLLRASLEKIAPSVGWIDSGLAIARRVESLLPVQKSSGISGHHCMIYTGTQADASWLSAVNQLGFAQILVWTESIGDAELYPDSSFSDS